MNERSEFYRKELRKDLSIIEVVNLLHSIVEELVDANGCSILLENNGKYYLASEKRKILLEKQEKSMALKALKEKKILTIKNVSDEIIYNSAIDNIDGEPITSEVFFPFSGEYTAVVCIWKNAQEEKEEVMTPLIVGNQIVSVSTTKTSKVKLKEFDEDDLNKIESIQSFIRDSIKKIYTKLPKEIDSFVYEDRQISSNKNAAEKRDFSLSELRRDLEFSLVQIEELESRSYENLDEEILEKSMTALIGSRTQIFEKLRNFITNIPREISSATKLLDIFEIKIENRKTKLCLKDLHLYTYIDPSIYSEIVLKKNSIKFFLGKLFDFCIDDVDTQGEMNLSLLPVGKNLECSISYDKKNFSETLLKLYRTYFESRSHYIFIKENGLDEELVLAYKLFTENGYTAGVDYKDSKLIFSFLMPYHPYSKNRFKDFDRMGRTKVGILFNRLKDYRSANLLARYLINMGLDMKNVVVSDNIDTFKTSSVTHFIVYQSCLSERVFDFFNEYREGNLKVLLFMEDCMDDSVEMFDFSSIDFYILKDDVYLGHLIYFLGSNLE